MIHLIHCVSAETADISKMKILNFNWSKSFDFFWEPDDDAIELSRDFQISSDIYRFPMILVKLWKAHMDFNQE